MSATLKPTPKPTIYHDGGRAYLELHAMRAPVGGYLAEYRNDPELGDEATQRAISPFGS